MGPEKHENEQTNDSEEQNNNEKNKRVEFQPIEWEREPEEHKPGDWPW